MSGFVPGKQPEMITMISSLAPGSRVIARDEGFDLGVGFTASGARCHQLTLKPVMATLKFSTVITCTGKKKPNYELLHLQPLQTATTDTKEEK